MKKLTLDLDALTIETFATVPAAGDEDGTVMAHARTDRFTCANCEPSELVADCSEPTINEWTCWDTCACPVSRDVTCLCV